MHIKQIAYFISPHGYGHAARASAIMEALYRVDPQIRFQVFTDIPEKFIRDSISADFHYHSTLTDIGLVQSSPLHADIDATVRQLDSFIPFEPGIINALSDNVKDRNCDMVICDIAPMGIAVAQKAGMPSLLIENFTWDWLYREYSAGNSNLDTHIDFLEGLFAMADYHIQAEPVCSPGNPDLTVNPVSRAPRTPSLDIRKDLNIADHEKSILVSMGGVPDRHPYMKELNKIEGYRFIIPGASENMKIQDNLIMLPHQSSYFHPDLINACDSVIGKVGYSTIAEIYYAGLPFGYIARENFRESQVLVSFIERHMEGLPLLEKDFYSGEWISILPALLALPRIKRQGPDGASQAAEFICSFI